MTRKAHDAMLAHLLTQAPLEGCGYLAWAQDQTFTLACPMTNILASRDYYEMDPVEQFEMMRRLRVQGLSVGAVYHSHPHGEAEPSVQDVRLAKGTNLFYLIVSLKGTCPRVRAWWPDDDVWHPCCLKLV